MQICVSSACMSSRPAGTPGGAAFVRSAGAARANGGSSTIGPDCGEGTPLDPPRPADRQLPAWLSVRGRASGAGSPQQGARMTMPAYAPRGLRLLLVSHGPVAKTCGTGCDVVELSPPLHCPAGHRPPASIGGRCPVLDAKPPRRVCPAGRLHVQCRTPAARGPPAADARRGSVAGWRRQMMPANRRMMTAMMIATTRPMMP